MREQDEQTRVFYDLCSMIIHILGSPPLPISFPSLVGPSLSASPSSSSNRTSQISPTAFASLFLGISVALMLFGSVIFVVGFILMPWVIALVLLFYFAGLVSTLSELSRAIVSFAASLPKDVRCKQFLEFLSCLQLKFVQENYSENSTELGLSTGA
ncbi:hypothetical protein RJ639_030021 [Escallonia herrerae]|uniref:Transmembrane protein n=1 Tax=Escallonia herrerae TaxID=1293975 RepID=A0AA89BH85_9ASTE|nr:hypothetical protein RJ639_030021 [Escallonia herrerae]